MGSPLDSAVGLALQASKGTAIAQSTAFKYLLFERATISASEVQRAFGRLAGSLKSLPKGALKTGVYCGGDMDIIGAPEALGWYLLGLMGQAGDPSDNGDGTYDHEFTFDSSGEFTVPYFTLRKRTAGLWHEQFTDVRIASLTMSVPATDMVRFNIGMLGITPQMVVNSDWSPASYLDAGEPFLSCVASFTHPTFGTLKATNVTVVQANAIALDEEWIVGSYVPDDLTLGGRSVLIDCIIHADEDIYGSAVYDPDHVAAAADTWTPEILSDGLFALTVSTQEDTAQSLKVEFDGDANESGNIDWTVQPVTIAGAANKQLMRLTGIAKQQASGTQLKWTLTNTRSTKYE